jgi:hypothetical protein
MHDNRTSDQPEAAGPTLADLDVGELTAALGASDMPARVRDAPRDQVTAWAQQGLDRLGADAVRERAERTAARNGAYPNHTAEQQAEYHSMWPSAARLRAANDAGHGLRKHLAAELTGAPESEVQFSGRPAAYEAERQGHIDSVANARRVFAEREAQAREVGDAAETWANGTLAKQMGEALNELGADESGRPALYKPPAAEISHVDTEAECRAEAAAIFSTPEATPDEVSWAGNWGAEAETAEAAEPEMELEAV